LNANIIPTIVAYTFARPVEKKMAFRQSGHHAEADAMRALRGSPLQGLRKAFDATNKPCRLKNCSRTWLALCLPRSGELLVGGDGVEGDFGGGIADFLEGFD
jgi:hypothetical protein